MAPVELGGKARIARLRLSGAQHDAAAIYAPARCASTEPGEMPIALVRCIVWRAFDK